MYSYVLINTHVQQNTLKWQIVYLYINSTYSYQTFIFNFLNVISETYTKYFVIYLQSLSKTYSNLAIIIYIYKMRSTMWTRTQWWSDQKVRGFWFYFLWWTTKWSFLSEMFWTIKSNVDGSIICDEQTQVFFLHVLNNEVRGFWFYCVLYTGKCLLFTLVLNYEARSFRFTLYLNITFIYLVILS